MEITKWRAKQIHETLKKMRVNTLYLGSAFGGLAIDHGKYIATLANQLSSYCLPSALVLGGETVVKVSECHQNGIGGRNQEACIEFSNEFRI